MSSVSGAMTSVSTRPSVIAPPSSRRPMIFLLMSLVVVAGQVDDHGRLHSRPIRRIISKAEAGPQVPDSYGSGLPCVAQ